MEGNPGHRPITAPVDTPKPDGIPPYPSDLKAAGKAAWNRYWKYGAAWLAETDLHIVATLCRLHDQEAAIRRQLDREGWFIVSDKTGRSYTHALVDRLDAVRTRMLPLWIELHMTPTSRAKANVKVPTVDPLQAWMAK